MIKITTGNENNDRHNTEKKYEDDRLCKDCGKSCKRVPKDGRCKRCTKAQAYYVDYPINNK